VTTGSARSRDQAALARLQMSTTSVEELTTRMKTFARRAESATQESRRLKATLDRMSLKLERNDL
jgi:hypothetical protein